jgi:hypothetical protein
MSDGVPPAPYHLALHTLCVLLTLLPWVVKLEKEHDFFKIWKNELQISLVNTTWVWVTFTLSGSFQHLCHNRKQEQAHYQYALLRRSVKRSQTCSWYWWWNHWFSGDHRTSDKCFLRVAEVLQKGSGLNGAAIFTSLSSWRNSEPASVQNSEWSW